MSRWTLVLLAGCVDLSEPKDRDRTPPTVDTTTNPTQPVDPCAGLPEPRVDIPGAWPDPQAAIDGGATGTLCVADGAWGPVDVGDADVVIAGGQAAVFDGGDARAFDVADGSLRLVGPTIRGGCGVAVAGGSLTVESVWFDGITCPDRGAAVKAASADVTLNSVLVEDAVVAADDVIGGLVSIDGGTTTLTDVTFRGGSVDAVGFVHGGAVGIVSADVVGTRVNVQGLQVDAAQIEGGGWYLFSGTLTLRNPIVTAVRATAVDGVEGAAVASAGSFSTLDVAHATFAGNTSTAVNCSGAAVQITSSPGVMSHGIVAFNEQLCDAITGGGVDVNGDDFTAHHTDLFGHDAGDWTGSPDPDGLDGNLRVDPGFLDLAAGDVRLDPGSPLIDAGDPATTDRDGSVADLGAYGGPDAP